VQPLQAIPQHTRCQSRYCRRGYTTSCSRFARTNCHVFVPTKAQIFQNRSVAVALMCTSGIMFLTSVFDSLINTIVATLIKIFCHEADVFAGEAAKARQDINAVTDTV
jgi:hypothetical protein